MIAMTHVGAHNTSQREYLRDRRATFARPWCTGRRRSVDSGRRDSEPRPGGPNRNSYNPSFVARLVVPFLLPDARARSGRSSRTNCDSDVANNLSATTWAVKPAAGATPIHLDNAGAPGVADGAAPPIDTFPRSTPFETTQGSGQAVLVHRGVAAGSPGCATRLDGHPAAALDVRGRPGEGPRRPGRQLSPGSSCRSRTWRRRITSRSGRRRSPARIRRPRRRLRRRLRPRRRRRHLSRLQDTHRLRRARARRIERGARRHVGRGPSTSARRRVIRRERRANRPGRSARGRTVDCRGQRSSRRRTRIPASTADRTRAPTAPEGWRPRSRPRPRRFCTRSPGGSFDCRGTGLPCRAAGVSSDLHVVAPDGGGSVAQVGFGVLVGADGAESRAAVPAMALDGTQRARIRGRVRPADVHPAALHAELRRRRWRRAAGQQERGARQQTHPSRFYHRRTHRPARSRESQGGAGSGTGERRPFRRRSPLP